MPTGTAQVSQWYKASDFGVFVSPASAQLDQAANLTNAIAAIATAGGGVLELPVGTVSGSAASVWIGSTVTLLANVGLYLPYGCTVQAFTPFSGSFMFTLAAGGFVGLLGQGIIDGGSIPGGPGGVSLTGVNSARIEPTIQHCTGDGVYLSGCSDVVILGARIINNGGYGIHEAGASAANSYLAVDLSGNTSGGVSFVAGSASRYVDLSALQGNPSVGSIPFVGPGGQMVTSQVASSGSGASGTSISAVAGTGDVSGAGGSATIQGGTGGATGVGGAATILGGSGGATSGGGGAASLTGGAGGGGNSLGGNASVTGGAASGSSTGAVASLTGGTGGATGAGGNVNVVAGAGGVTSGAGGAAALVGGNARGGNSAGGLASVLGGSGNGNGAGGPVSLQGGSPGLTGNGGNATVQGGSGGLTSGNGGTVTIAGGVGGLSAGTGGDVIINAGSPGGGTTPGQLIINRVSLQVPILGTSLASLSTGNQTLTAANLIGGFIEHNATGASTDTFDTGANISALIHGGFNGGDSFQCLLANTGSATITLQNATGITLFGATSVSAGTTVLIMLRCTAVNTWKVYLRH